MVMRNARQRFVDKVDAAAIEHRSVTPRRNENRPATVIRNADYATVLRHDRFQCANESFVSVSSVVSVPAELPCPTYVVKS